MTIAVAGGTGLMGRLVIQELRSSGCTPVVLSRSHGVDLTTGRGLDAALDGADAVVDVGNVTTTSRARSLGYFGTATSHLLDASARAGVRHLVALSVVGVDRVGLGYYAGKLRQEELLAAGGGPWTVLRATQFHEFAGQLLSGVRGPLVPVPRMLSRPVAAREVAAELVRLVQREPQGMATPIAGPEQLMMPEMVRRLLSAQGSRRLVIPVPVPGATGRALSGGGLLPEGDFVHAKQTYDEYLLATSGGRP
ncbi:SDR family oxidoreductase [Motilibacter aurantiacus]|uniref:SDR family oxidoreductase n=1 Tax=Motilibacter aurantiacus TaxID=2714955 RepID=UPI00140E727F|nr:NAD(P)H-binding protein [Motilibacter aurantiacus]NHC46146.1 SDR family oxidoreductase [Motilibacter aurantiacus]